MKKDDQNSNGKMFVRDVIHRNILTCSPVESLREVARRMSERRCSSILVVEHDKAVGIWTEHDALRLDLEAIDCSKRPISEYMSSPVKTISDRLSLEEASLAIKENHIRHYLVVGEKNERLGMITQTDIILNQNVKYFLFLKKVSSIIASSSPSISAGAALSEAMRVMHEAKADAIAVMFSSGSPGILSERDVIHAMAGGKSKSLVGDIATPSMMMIDADETIYSARNIMVRNGFRHIGVCGKKGKFIGIINFSDILKSMVDGYYQYLKEELLERTENLHEAEEHLALSNKIIETAQDGVMVTDEHGIIQSVNPAFSQITGYASGEVIGKTPDILQSGRHNGFFFQEMWEQIKSVGRWRGEIWNRRKSGEVYPTILTISRIENKERKSVHYAALFSDISTLKKREEDAKRLALYDPLTGLPNRRLLEDRISHTLAAGARYQGKCGALFFCDLDYFKQVNDSFGHDVGDRLLVEVAERLAQVLRKEDTAARLGGDEFIVLLPNLGRSGEDAKFQAGIVAEKIRKEIEAPYHVEGHTLKVTATLGMTLFEGKEDSFSSLIKEADIAMYHAKKEGRNQVCFYNPSLGVRVPVSR